MSSTISIVLNDGTQVTVDINVRSSHVVYIEGNSYRTEIEDEEAVGERRMSLLHKYVFTGRKRALVSSTEEETVADVKELVCAICLEKVAVGEEVASTPCMHQFHTSCIQLWLQKAGTCPLCRSDIDI